MAHRLKKNLPTNAWIVVDEFGGIEYENLYPMIFIQKTKPIVWKVKSEKPEKVIKIKISKVIKRS